MERVEESQQSEVKVLVLEPEESLQGLFSAILEREGYLGTCVQDGNEAVAALGTDDYEAIIIDLSLSPSSMEHGGRRGIGFLHHLQRASPGLLRRVIVVTALAERHVPGDLPAVCSFLRKPFDLDELRSALKNCRRANS